MNPHSDCTPTKKQTKALYQAQMHANPVKRSLEQSSDTVRRRNARTNQAVQEHESEQRAAAREVPGVREQEQSANTVRRAIARDEPGVPEHESAPMVTTSTQYLCIAISRPSPLSCRTSPSLCRIAVPPVAVIVSPVVVPRVAVVVPPVVLSPVAVVMPRVAVVVPHHRTARRRRCAARHPADPCRRCVTRHRSAPCRCRASRHRRRVACVVVSPVASSCHMYSKNDTL